jgi:hypothetical protein
MHHRNYENLYYCNYENLYSKICKLQQVTHALNEASKMASKCTQYYGSKGWLKDE